MAGSRPRLFSRGLPLVPLAPAIVVLVGLATALVIALFGIAQLQQASDNAALLRAQTLSAALAARLRATALEDRSDIIGAASHRSGSEILLVEQDGHVLVHESPGKPSTEAVLPLLVAGAGQARGAAGPTAFAAKPLQPPLEHLSVIVVVEAPHPPSGSGALVRAVATLTALLIGMAVAVALAFTKAIRDDVEYLQKRIVHMARAEADPAGEPVAIRSFDEVGVLTVAFNVLVGRFAAAERTYRADLVQASESDRERSIFLAGLSHELRTPLNAILGFTHVLETEVDGPLTPDGRESLAIVRSSGEHLRTLIDDILDLSAMETGTLQLLLRPVNVRTIADNVVREARATVRQKRLKLSVGGQKEVYANADKRRVRQILTNLVSNAVKFTAAGHVALNIEARDEFAVITVNDTGTGISPEETSAIFEEYRQSGDFRLRHGGTGLGLSITRRLVHMHGGSIEVKSQLGRGSTFTVMLPLYPGDPKAVVDPFSVSGAFPEANRASLPSIDTARTSVTVEGLETGRASTPPPVPDNGAAPGRSGGEPR